MPNFPMLKRIVGKAKEMNQAHGKRLSFVVATNLALLDDEILEFCAEEDIYFLPLLTVRKTCITVTAGRATR